MPRSGKKGKSRKIFLLAAFSGKRGRPLLDGGADWTLSAVPFNGDPDGEIDCDKLDCHGATAKVREHA
jgi:hypothetical protein